MGGQRRGEARLSAQPFVLSRRSAAPDSFAGVVAPAQLFVPY
jgi:hypothetical protein